MPNADSPPASNWKQQLISLLSNWKQQLICLLPLIVPVIVVITFVSFYNWFLLCSTEHPCSPFTAAEILAGVSNTDQARAAIYVARASWTLINGVNALASLLAIATACFVIHNILSERKVNGRATIILLIVFAAINIALAVSLWASGDVSSPAQQLLRATVGQGLPWINKYNRGIEALSLTGTLALAAAACAVLWRPDTNLDQKTLQKRKSLLNPVLYVAAATLVLAVLRLAATHAWAVSFLPTDNEFGTAIKSLTTGIVASLGTLYTLLIAGIYLPAALILRARIKKVAPDQPDSDTWLQFLPKAIALISPLLAGPMGDVLVKVINSLGGGA
jgi:hypothetical protein